MGRLEAVLSMMVWAAPLAGQSGPGSDQATVALTASKAASVGVSIEGVGPILVATGWAMESARTASLSLVVYTTSPSPAAPTAPAGGPKRRADGADKAPAAVVLFRQPISPAAAVGARTDELQVGTEGSPATVNLLVITQ